MRDVEVSWNYGSAKRSVEKYRESPTARLIFVEEPVRDGSLALSISDAEALIAELEQHVHALYKACEEGAE